ncbi:hypothetical protein J6590_008129 [Homalodisca vitripennis]|nr:hypothetical protein J6590_008129 [Homalodisca vitripennis]
MPVEETCLGDGGRWGDRQQTDASIDIAHYHNLCLNCPLPSTNFPTTTHHPPLQLDSFHHGSKRDKLQKNAANAPRQDGTRGVVKRQKLLQDAFTPTQPSSAAAFQHTKLPRRFISQPFECLAPRERLVLALRERLRDTGNTYLTASTRFGEESWRPTWNYSGSNFVYGYLK